jgi:hypothetical protein
LTLDAHLPENASITAKRRTPDGTVAETLAWSKLDAEGRFEIALATGGPVQLEIVLRPGTYLTRSVASWPLMLEPGRTAWSASLETGSLRVRRASEEKLSLVLELERADGLRSSDFLSAKDGVPGDLVSPLLPTGTYRITRYGSESTFWREVEIRAGEETVVDYP